jgi:hypothetical protein
MERIHIWIFRDDAAFLRENYAKNIGVAKAVRTIVHGFRKRVDERQAETQHYTPPIPQDFDFKVEDLVSDEETTNG